jgi:hypothetical protein
MRAMSIIIAIMVGTLQISSTFAQPAAANPDSGTTSNRFPITINVVANDFTAAGVQADSDTPILALTQPVIKMGTGNGVGGPGLASLGFVGGTILYTPVAGFSGMVTFTYSIPTTTVPTAAPTSSPNHSSGCASYGCNPTSSPVAIDVLTGTVTVTVSARKKSGKEFKGENQFSTDDSALATVDLSAVVALNDNVGNSFASTLADFFASFRDFFASLRGV